jgi:signal transduction histidine kinase
MRKIGFLILLLVVIGIGLLHFFTPGDLSFYHGLYRRLSYFPIVLGAIWFGLWGGLTLAFFSSIAFIPHVLLYIGQGTEAYLGELVEIVLYMAAGGVTGFIASREAKLKKKYRLLSEELEKSYERLHHEAELILEVEEQLQASQRLSELGKLSASLAHEIKNPLSSIRGTAEILLEEFPEEHSKREFADILIKEVSRLNTTVERVLRYARGQTRKGEGEGISRVSLSDVLQQVVNLLENQLKKKNIDFAISGNGEEADCQVDGDRLSQVFLNLILNSIDAVDKGGKIRVVVTISDDGCKITVADNGPGIRLEDREEIFKPFVSGKVNGTGLGLSISRKIIRSYGGTLTASESDYGGALFEIWLPRYPHSDSAGVLGGEFNQEDDRKRYSGRGEGNG